MENKEKKGLFRRFLNFLMPSTDKERLENVCKAKAEEKAQKAQKEKEEAQTVESLTDRFDNACDRINDHYSESEYKFRLRSSASIIAIYLSAVALNLTPTTPNPAPLRFWCCLAAVASTGIYAKLLYDWNKANKTMRETYNTLKEKISLADNKKEIEIIDKKAEIAKKQGASSLNLETGYKHACLAVFLFFSALKQDPRLSLLCYAGVLSNIAFCGYTLVVDSFNSSRVEQLKKDLKNLQRQRT